MVVTNDERLPVKEALLALGTLAFDAAAAEQMTELDLPRTSIQLLRGNPGKFAVAATRLLQNMANAPAGLEALLSYGVSTMAELAFLPGNGPLQQHAAVVLQHVAAAVGGSGGTQGASHEQQSALALAQMAASSDVAAR